jgi:hypothetical protein
VRPQCVVSRPQMSPQLPQEEKQQEEDDDDEDERRR